MKSVDLFNHMREVVRKNPEKFFMNIHEYNGARYAMFDYSLVMPFHFDSYGAFECRGSLFEVDENNEFVRVASRPYEKFLNLHEYDYEGNEPLYKAVKARYGVDIRSSEDIKKLEVACVMNKEDGSIISSFLHNGDLDLKSNSSLTSDYKYLALDLLKEDTDMYVKSKVLTQNNFTVIYELVSHHPKYQIVLPYDRERLIVTGVRDNDTGEYFSYEELVSYFGEDKVAPAITDWDWSDQKNKTDIEGYVIWFKCGLRVKLKTEWYVERHNLKANLGSTPRHLWEMFIRGTLDDAYGMLSHNQYMVDYFNKMSRKCEELYDQILRDGIDYYEANKNLDMKDYHIGLKNSDFDYHLSHMVAAKLKAVDGDISQVLGDLHEKLLVRKNISRLGIIDWY